MRKEFWQSHDCSGYRAKISIEWETPRGVDELAGDRQADAEVIADQALAALARKPLEIVQAMMGRTSS